MYLQPPAFWNALDVKVSNEILSNEVQALPSLDKVSAHYLARIICKIAGQSAMTNKGTLRTSPPRVWNRIAADWSSAALQRLADFSPDDFASTLSAFRSMKDRPRPELWREMISFFMDNSAFFTGDEVAKVSYAVGRLDLPVSFPFCERIDALCKAGLQKEPRSEKTMSPDAFSDALIGLLKMKHSPSKQLLSAVQSLSEDELRQFPPRSLAILCKAFHRARRLPSEAFGRAFVALCHQQIDHFKPEAMAEILNAPQSYFPSLPGLRKAYLPIATRKIDLFSLEALSFAPSAFAPFRGVETDAFICAYDTACVNAMPSMSPRQLSRGINSYARTARMPSKDYLVMFETRADKAWKRFHADDVSRTLLAYSLFSIENPKIAQTPFAAKLLEAALTAPVSSTPNAFIHRHKALFDNFKIARQILAPRLSTLNPADPLKRVLAAQGFDFLPALFTLPSLWAGIDYPGKVGERFVAIQKNQHGTNGDPLFMSAMIRHVYPEAVIVNLSKPVYDELIHPENKETVKDMLSVLSALPPQVYQPELRKDVLSIIPLAELLARKPLAKAACPT